ncbi:hypothetical protein ASZ90_015886 [hydrocarbon metagenome]|uniref:Uncharacterized protein n=1 Tax=hydrocarbon metagenome TaxID=938273 RepID=A0A0W8F0S1_9ZZZZ
MRPWPDRSSLPCAEDNPALSGYPAGNLLLCTRMSPPSADGDGPGESCFPDT